MNMFSYAIEMERDGERFYEEQAELNKNNSLYPVCIMLAEDEKHHLEILTKKLSEMEYVLKDLEILANSKNVFKEIQNISLEEKETLSQLDFYKAATEMEQKSIDLYTGFLKEVEKDADKELFSYLIKQEQQHYNILDELSTMLRRAEEWVESAEFGDREEY
ncbi:MAG: ferritin family protein [Lachnospiraceae bacterium]|nr:ferritin family protein [Lachnospiraceae bacterium]